MNAPTPSAALALIVYHSDLERARRCLDSLEAQDHPDLRIAVVDHSRDGDGYALVGGRDRVRLVRPAENEGFGAGVRAGLASDSSAIVLLLNPDAWVEPSWARRMSEALGAGEKVGMAAVRVRSGPRPDRLDSAGLGVSRGGSAVLRGHGAPLRAARRRLDRVPLLGPAGAAAAYRRELLEALGGFPSVYFLYYEDLELAWRARRRGWSCAWVDEPLVTHDHVSKAAPRTAYYLHRGRRLFRLRNWPRALCARHRVDLAVEGSLSWLRAARRGGLRQASRARRDAGLVHAGSPNSFAEEDGPVDPDWLVPATTHLGDAIRARMPR